MSRLRRRLNEAESAILAEVVRERRKTDRIPLSAWVFLPDHWHAIILSRSPLTISGVMPCPEGVAGEAIKAGGTKRINAGRGENGLTLKHPG